MSEDHRYLAASLWMQVQACLTIGEPLIHDPSDHLILREPRPHYQESSIALRPSHSHHLPYQTHPASQSYTARYQEHNASSHPHHRHLSLYDHHNQQHVSQPPPTLPTNPLRPQPDQALPSHRHPPDYSTSYQLNTYLVNSSTPSLGLRAYELGTSVTLPAPSNFTLVAGHYGTQLHTVHGKGTARGVWSSDTPIAGRAFTFHEGDDEPPFAGQLAFYGKHACQLAINSTSLKPTGC